MFFDFMLPSTGPLITFPDFTFAAQETIVPVDTDCLVGDAGVQTVNITGTITTC